jgi:hypothetical protein
LEITQWIEVQVDWAWVNEILFIQAFASKSHHTPGTSISASICDNFLVLSDATQDG